MLVSVILEMSLSWLLFRDTSLMLLKRSIIPCRHCLYLVVDNVMEGFLAHSSLHGLAHVRYGILDLCD